MHVLTSLEVGGAEMLAVQMVRRFAACGYRVSVVTLRRRGELAASLDSSDVTVTSLDVPPGRGALALARALAREVRAQRPDVIHSHNLSPLIAASLATMLMPGVRLIHTEHGRSSAFTRGARLALRIASRRAADIVAVSEDAAEWAVSRNRLPRRKIRIIRNGIATGPRPAFRPRAGCRAITVARLEPVKDIDTMLHAAAIASAILPAFQLDICGDGAERISLEQTAAALGLGGRVTFHGFRDDVPEMLANANVYLSSSRSEGIALSLLEAMAAGLPIVATAVGGTPEVVIDGVTGRLVPAANPDALADAIVSVLSHPDDALTMGVAARDRVESEFSLDAMIDRYRELYDAT